MQYRVQYTTHPTFLTLKEVGYFSRELNQIDAGCDCLPSQLSRGIIKEAHFDRVMIEGNKDKALYAAGRIIIDGLVDTGQELANPLPDLQVESIISTIARK